MKFKGTKGKWFIELIGSYFRIVGSKKSETKANALLISKAPEMLNILQRVSECRILTEMSNIHPITNEIKQLIKEATEL